MNTTYPSICRVCPNSCSVHVETKNGRVVGVLGDPENPVYHGYTCIKGREHWTLYDHPERLVRSLKRTADGTYQPIPLDDAIGEISARLEAIIDRHGVRSVAMFWGTFFAIDNPINMSMGGAFMKAIGSPMVFSPNTVDQPGKHLAKGLHGLWMAPGQAMHDPKVVLMMGTNPLVSHQGRLGHPADLVKNLKHRGGKLIVVDPRRTDIAKRADLYLQPRPGEDVAILAGIIRVILEEDLYDAVFVGDNVDGFEELRAAVQPFTPAYVGERAGIDAADVVEAARMFGRASRGYATAGTGPNMAGVGTLVEYLILCLDTLCGHWLRAAERVKNALSIVPAAAQMAKAQALPPFPAFGYGEHLRVRALTDTPAGLPTAAMAEEILMPGEGQVRALLSLSGNPLNSVPDQLQNIKAFKSLELLIQADVQMSPTARMADYVIASKLPYEMPTTSLLGDFLSLYANGWGYEDSFAQYAPAVVEPPAGSEVIEQWKFLYRIAQAMALKLEFYPGFGELLAAGPPTTLDMTEAPSSEELLTLIHADSRIPLEEVKRHPHGALFRDPPVWVDAKDPDWQGRLDVGNQHMMSDLRAVAADGAAAIDPDFPFRLICRRMMHITGSPTIARPPNQRPYNSAFLHPEDLAVLGVAAGDVVEIRSSHAAILAVAQPDATLRPSTVSIAHSWGDTPEFDADVRRIGSNPGRLVANGLVYDRYSGQPRMSNIPVRITPHPPAQTIGQTTSVGSSTQG